MLLMYVTEKVLPLLVISLADKKPLVNELKNV